MLSSGPTTSLLCCSVLCVCSAKLPVMVWFHGGAFLFGEGTERPWTVHEDDGLTKKGVVNVSVNYRFWPAGLYQGGGGRLELRHVGSGACHAMHPDVRCKAFHRPHKGVG
jgi:hypothetical protein